MRVALIAALAMAAPSHAAPARDWTRVASATPAGDLLLGNPAAKVRLVESLSLTCPHCAVFEKEAARPLLAYVRTGRVSWEVRLALRDGWDMAAALQARCLGPGGFFAVLPPLYAAQEQWLAKGAAWSQTAPDLDKLPPGEAMKRIAAGAGLDAFFAAHGLPAAKGAACLADKAAEDRLAARAEAIWKAPGMTGTPAFAINGAAVADVRDWPTLKAKLDAALR